VDPPSYLSFPDHVTNWLAFPDLTLIVPVYGFWTMVLNTWW
jgi:hypothetical protein